MILIISLSREAALAIRTRSRARIEVSARFGFALPHQLRPQSINFCY